MYEYAADVLRVVDGDTIRVRLDLGVDVRVDLTLRLAGINAPEHGTPAGDAATAYLIATLGPLPRPVVVNTVKDRREKYGRYLATVRLLPDGTDVNALMVSSGHAVVWDGHGPRPNP